MRCVSVAKFVFGLILFAALAGALAFIIMKYQQRQKDPRPHIVVFLASDLGFDDVSFHGNDQIPTPNIDAFAADGVILNRHYSAQAGTPSKGSLLTGKLPLHIGLHETPGILNGVYGTGLPLNHKLLPEYMRELGYETHLIGKWSLGYYKNSLLPTNRGFDSHYGPYGEASSYYSHLSHVHWWDVWKVPAAFDFHFNGKPIFESFGRYVTDLYNSRFKWIVELHKKPLFVVISHAAPHGATPGPLYQFPEIKHSTFNHIKNTERKSYAELVKTLDDAFGYTVEILKRNGILNETVILFSSDNGGTTNHDPEYKTGASNWPFRGQKNTQWEGGVRVATFIWSSALPSSYVNNKLYHFADWLPTFYSLGGGNASKLESLDGIDIWESLKDKSTASPRKNLLLVYNRENTVNVPAYAAIMGRYKLISGQYRSFNQTNFYLPANHDFKSDSTMLEILRKNSLAAKILTDLGRTKTPAHNWRAKATVECSWGAELSCNGSPCNNFQKMHQTSSDFNEIEIKPIDSSLECDFAHSSCLFDLEHDPCETTNIASKFPNITIEIENFINEFEATEPASRENDRECFDQNSRPDKWDPPVWKPWRMTCDGLLNENCSDPIDQTEDGVCPPGRSET